MSPNGHDACQARAAAPTRRHVPVLLLTGTFEAFDEERAVRCGAAGHIAKPFEAQTLLDEVQRLFALAATRRPAAAAPPAPSAQRVEAERSVGPHVLRAAPAEPPVRVVTPSAATRSAAPPAPPPAARAAADPGDSFDFFDEEIDDLLPAELADDASLGSDREVDLDSSETPFAFGEEEPRPAPARSVAPPAPDLTVALPPQPAALRATARRAAETADVAATIGETDLARLDGETPGPSRPASAERTRVGQALEAFDLDTPAAGDDSLLRVDESDLAGATVLDPQSAGSFDVSASDLGDPFALDAPVETPRAEPAGSRPSARSAARESTAIDATALELLEPEPEPPPQPDFPEDRALVVPAAEPAPEPDAEVSALARSAVETVGPRLRSQLHDTLEKVAWESPSDVTDQIVRHALERIEAIAWEVIPQMAETLIREEIRRMKGEDGS